MVDVARNLLVELTAENCCACGYTVWMQTDFVRNLKNSKRNFHCTSCGQVQGWHNASEADRLRKELANERKRTEWAQQDAINARAERDRLERSRRAERGLRTKLKKRIHNGVCPCCRRSFVDLQRHMAGQHPDFVQSPGV